MTPPYRLLVIADVGGEDRRHLGDEAMLEANLASFRRLIPEVAFTLVSRDPAWVTARYGVDAVATPGFPTDPSAGAQRRAMLDGLLAVATSGRRGVATVDAMTDADGLVVSGGGNLSSTWPDLLYERAALLHLARILGKPAVVLGQTLGPSLADAERRLVAEALSFARFVGLRELPSAALALELGVPEERLWYQCDDALCLDDSPATVATSGRSGAPTIAITIDPQIRASRGALFDATVDQLGKLAKTTGASLVLLPHAFGNEPASGPSDLTEARILAERLRLPQTVIAAGLDAERARQVTGDAALIISSRYHPIVFGLAAGVAALGIHGDEYCRIKLQGALAHARLDRWTLSYDDVAGGELLPTALELWRTRGEVRRDLEARREAWRDECRHRWAAVLRALDPAQTIPPLDPSTMFGRPMENVVPALLSALEAQRKARVSKAMPEHGPRRIIRRYAASLLRNLRRSWR
jgi:polysaccharide pyruvyl transferase WcaK-like protein